MLNNKTIFLKDNSENDVWLIQTINKKSIGYNSGLLKRAVAIKRNKIQFLNLISCAIFILWYKYNYYFSRK